jgi:cytochrome c-type biogenesis protein CcmH
MSPFCPGRTLATCTSWAAAVLRDEIAMRIAQGEPPEAVRADLISRYGSAISGEPPMSGPGLIVWVFPAVLALLLSAAVTVALSPRRATADAGTHADGESAADTAVLQRLDDELLNLD